jgi:hypothetical protein
VSDVLAVPAEHDNVVAGLVQLPAPALELALVIHCGPEGGFSFRTGAAGTMNGLRLDKLAIWPAALKESS